MDYAARLQGSFGLRYLEGSVAIHNDTGLLVAMGPEAFVEMVESIVTACQASQHERLVAPHSAPAGAPEK